MIKPTFSEVIKVKDGLFCNLPYHVARMNRTAKHFFGKEIEYAFAPESIPACKQTGLVKCRVVYSDEILETEFSDYSFKPVKTIAIVHDNTIEYPYKSTDRSRLNELLEASGCDEIIIVKNGYVTDSSCANIVLEDGSELYTPSTCLLPGIKREYLLNSSMVSERAVQLDDLLNVEKIHFINAMADLGDNVVCPDFIVKGL